MPSPASGILTITELAKYTQVTEKTIYKLTGAKKIPALKVEGSWRFSRTDIDGWIAMHTAAPLTTAMDSKRPIGRAP